MRETDEEDTANSKVNDEDFLFDDDDDALWQTQVYVVVDVVYLFSRTGVWFWTN